jgi:hypothetical protein
VAAEHDVKVARGYTFADGDLLVTRPPAPPPALIHCARPLAHYSPSPLVFPLFGLCPLPAHQMIAAARSCNPSPQHSHMHASCRHIALLTNTG